MFDFGINWVAELRSQLEHNQHAVIWYVAFHDRTGVVTVGRDNEIYEEVQHWVDGQWDDTTYERSWDD